jgi:hypothetical protein
VNPQWLKLRECPVDVDSVSSFAALNSDHHSCAMTSLPEAYEHAYGAALTAWKEDTNLASAADLFAEAAQSVAGLQGARFLHLDALLYAYKMHGVIDVTLGDDSWRVKTDEAAERVLDALADRRSFEMNLTGPRFDCCRPGLERDYAVAYVAAFSDSEAPRCLTGPLPVVSQLLDHQLYSPHDRAFDLALQMLYVTINDERARTPKPFNLSLHWHDVDDRDGYIIKGPPFSNLVRLIFVRTLEARLSARFPGGRQAPAILSQWPKAYTKCVLRCMKAASVLPHMQSDIDRQKFVEHESKVLHEGEVLLGKMAQLKIEGRL